MLVLVWYVWHTCLYMDDQTKINSNNVPSKHPLIYWAIGSAILSVIIGGEIGIIPLITIIISIVALTKTKIPNSGRWLAVVALIIGILYLIVNAYNNGHFEDQRSNDFRSYQYSAPNTNKVIEKTDSVSTNNEVSDQKPSQDNSLGTTQSASEMESPQCRRDKLNYDACLENLSHKDCISTWDYELSCGTAPAGETPSCRSSRLNYDSCRENLSHTTCLSTWDYESACGLVQTNESSRCRSTRLNYESCRENLSHAMCISTWDYETACN